ncbi:CCHC-type domain-containing protein [Trichonephila clavipes]|nr:CCHC-type domain-containing protein [Trichonephila clavipes]
MHKRRAKRFRIHYPRKSSKQFDPTHSRNTCTAPSPYITKRTGESSWRPRLRPRQENRPTQQDTGRKTVLWRTSHYVPICFHCRRPDHVTRYCPDRRRVFSAVRQRRQLDQYERWDSDCF